MNIRTAAWLAWSVCGLTVVLVACTVALAFLNGSEVRAVIFPLGVTLSSVVGGLVASRRPANPVGWFFLGIGGCMAITVVAAEYATHGLAGVQAMAWLASWLGVGGAAPARSSAAGPPPAGWRGFRRWPGCKAGCGCRE